MKTPKPLKLVVVLCLAGGVSSNAGPPRTPFTGVYGATVGAGSLVGWERLGGENPAAMGPAGFGASASGYTPFGLEGLRVTEAEAFYDRTQFGVSFGWKRFAEDAGSDASRLRFQGSWRLSRALSAGGFLSADMGSSRAAETGFGFGMLAHPHRFASVGIAWDNTPDIWGRVSRAQFGIDAGTPMPSGFGSRAAWRISVEYAHLFGVPTGMNGSEWRFGLELQLHNMMGVYAGSAPQLQTMGLGVRFGLGGFVGHSAMRRHTALGGTTIQGLGWSKHKRTE